MFKYWVSAAILASVLFAIIPTAQGDVEQDISARLKEKPDAHPRLFFSAKETDAIKAKIVADPLFAKLQARIQADCDVLLTQDPLKREKVGKRLLGVSRACLQRVSYLAFTWRVTQDERYLKRAEQEMLAVAAFEDWNPSHFLDVAEMTAALAIGYDWLYDGLGDASRKTIREAIVVKGLETSRKGGGWVTGDNNWNQVCHGGLTLGALAVYEDHRELAEFIIARGVKYVPRTMAVYEPDGVYPEGPSYWEYGTTYNVLMIAALQSALKTDFGLTQAKAFMKTPEFYLRATGPSGLFFNYADCGVKGGVSPAMYWFARQLKDPGLLWHEKGELAEFVERKPDKKGGGNRVLPFLLIWGESVGDLSAPKGLSWKGDGPTPVAILRNAWTPDATYAGLKGGSPGANHGHMDVGSFVLDMQGVRWSVDLGSQGYHELEARGLGLWNRKQDSDRWTVFRLNNYSHSTLVVDGQLQRMAGDGRITRFSDDPESSFAVLDMGSAYEGQLAKAERGLRLRGASLLVQDEVRALDRPASVRWAMTTRAEVKIGEGGRATLTQDGKTVSFRVVAPADAKLAVYEAEKPPREHDEPNPNTRMVGFETSIPAGQDQTLCVWIEPGEGSANVPETAPLAKW